MVVPAVIVLVVVVVALGIYFASRSGKPAQRPPDAGPDPTIEDEIAGDS